MDLTALSSKIWSKFTGNEALRTEIEDALIKAKSAMPKNTALEAITNAGFVFPFNDFEFILASMLAKDCIKYEDYLELRHEFLVANPNLKLFELAPRTFGETYCQSWLIEKSGYRLAKAHKKLDPKYQGEYDIWYKEAGWENGIRIEVKASRATDASPGMKKVAPIKKALPSNTTKIFDMNFQQLKPSCCDVFVWIAVYTDAEIIWVMSSKEVEKSKYYTDKMHRGGKEGQLHINQGNIREFDRYIATKESLIFAIKHAAFRNRFPQKSTPNIK